MWEAFTEWLWRHRMTLPLLYIVFVIGVVVGGMIAGGQ